MLAYMKVSPTTYVLHYQGGRVRRQGPGLAFWYLRPVSTIVAVPLASRDVPFAFNEVTADFQPVTLQGQLTYRVADPARFVRPARLQRANERPVPLRRPGEGSGAAGADGANHRPNSRATVARCATLS